jgi:hypothetical protein
LVGEDGGGSSVGDSSGSAIHSCKPQRAERLRKVSRDTALRVVNERCGRCKCGAIPKGHWLICEDSC